MLLKQQFYTLSQFEPYLIKGFYFNEKLIILLTDFKKSWLCKQTIK